MPDYTQEDQPIRVDTALAEDVLLLAGFQGSEKLSEPYVFDLELLSEDPNLDPDDLLRTPISVTLLLPDGEERQIHGRVRSFGYEGRRGELSFYRAEMVPWLWFLSLSHNCRIFQHLSVPDIVKEVFGDYEGVEFRTQFAQDYAEREYCVQYRESDLNFVSRLLEEEGIFYFFEHGEDGHTLVLTDYSQMQPCEGQAEVRMYSEAVTQQDVVKALTHRQAVHSGVVSLADYDEMKPSLDLTSSMAGDEPEEIYEYQKNLFRELDEGERYARIALEREEATRHVVRGHGTCRSFQTGHRFTLTNHDRREANRDYALVEVRHRARTGTYVAGGGAGELDYENHFVAVPHGTTYRPPLRARKPTMPGSQTAKVVGPGGEKINVDDQGRVKVQFHWDRLGSEDENSSCWVRVSQNWAGKNWGGMFIPHIGHEVIVDFIEGDPDRPIITGRVYNAENPPPESLPANKHRSIIEDDYGNEMVFDATPGEEHIRIHSPTHMSTMQIGRSFKFWSKSSWSQLMEGENASITLGMSIGGHWGFKGSLDLGGTLSLFAGFKLEASLAQKLEFALGSTLKVSAGPEYKAGKTDFTHHVGGKALLKSDEEVLVVGGHNSLMETNKDQVRLQHGANDSPHTVKSEVAGKAVSVATTLAGVISAIGVATHWEMNEDPKAYGGLAAIPAGLGATGGVVQAGMAFYKKRKAKNVQITPDALHSSVHSQLLLNDEGGQLAAKVPKGGDPKAWLVATVEGKAAVVADQRAFLESKSENVQIVSRKGDVNVDAQGTVDIRSRSNKVLINGKNMVEIG